MSCDPLPSTFLFPTPSPGQPAAYQRCATFDVNGTASLAISPDGRLVALVGGDAIVRVVNVRLHTLVAVLAPPQAQIDLAAFSSSGDYLVTVARGERQVTAWDVNHWGPSWTVVLPGQRYSSRGHGGVAFSPDSLSVAVSPGDDLFLLDAKTGAIRISRAPAASVVADVAFGWRGQRIAVVDGKLGGHCAKSAWGGQVSILQAQTLTTVAVVAVRCGWSECAVPQGTPVLRASPTEDLVLTSGEAGNAVEAFRLSDGGMATVPSSLNAEIPVSFMPDGAHVLMADESSLRVLRLADGVTTASAPVAGLAVSGRPGALAASADGRIVALGGRGAELLRVWDTRASQISRVCTADDRPADDSIDGASMSADGGLLAFSWGASVLIVRRSDGVRLATLQGDGGPANFVRLSPDGRFVLASFPNGRNTIVFRIADGARVVLVPDRWERFTFSEDGNVLYDSGADAFSLDPPGGHQLGALPRGTILGAWAGCLLSAEWSGLGYGALSRRGAGCDGISFGSVEDGEIQALAVGGKYMAVASGPRWPVVVWRNDVTPTAVRQFTPLGGDPWFAEADPLAISPDGRRVAISTAIKMACSPGPLFDTHIYDLESCAVLGTIPPSPSGSDVAGTSFVYGSQLWCLR